MTRRHVTARWTLSVVVWSLLVTAVHAVQSGELIERTLAIVGGQVITMADAQTALGLRLVDAAEDSNDIEEMAAHLVDRLLMLREVQRYAPPEPAGQDIDERVAAIRDQVGDAQQFDRLLAAGGFTEARLRAWVRDDLRIASYLSQRFSAVALPADQILVGAAREELSTERRTALIADWVADLRRRTPVVELYRR